MQADLEQRLRFCRNLPTLPGVALRVIDLGNDPEADLGQVADVIAQDPALATKLLRTANSPLYGLRRRSHNLRQALNLLGLDAALTLALSFSLRSTTQEDATGLDTDLYWRRSLLAATACRTIGEQRTLPGLEELFLAGLLQDIGMLVLDRIMPAEYRLLLEANADHPDLVDAERGVLGADHGQVGAWLLKQWRLPEYLHQSVAASNDPTDLDVPAEYREMAACVAVSGLIADVWLNPGDEITAGRAVEAAAAWLDMDEEEYRRILDTMGSALPDIAALFEVQLLDPATQVAAILDEAKELLTLRSLRLHHKESEAHQRLEELESRTQRLEVENRLDSLTGLYNRRALEEILQKEFSVSRERGWPLSLAFMDLDHFKRVNDTFGHQVGDAVLTAVARLLAGNIRQTDLLARYGGEEFVLLLPGTPLKGAQGLLERLLEKLRSRELLLEQGQAVRVTASIGLATHQDGRYFDSVGDLLQAADQAVYAAKRAGRDRLLVGGDRVI